MMLSAGNGFIMQSEKYSRDNAGQSLKKYTLLKKGELAYNHGASKAKQFGCCHQLEVDEALVPFVYHCFSVNKEYAPYVASVLNTPTTERQLKKLVSSSVRMDGLLNISFDDYMTVELALPSMDEQQKVFSFVSLIEEKIKKQQQLVELLKKYKRGVMREIFESKKIFTTHHYTLVQLGNECRFFSGGTPQSGNSKYYGGSIPFIRSGEVHKFTTELTLTEEGLNNSSAKMVEVGDLIMALYGATSGEVDISKISGAINQAILCIRPQTINRQYLKFLFECKKEDILKTYLQGGQGNLSAEIIKKLCFEIPLPSEQQETVDFLAALENKISLEESKLEQLFNIRSGLLQQLFI